MSNIDLRRKFKIEPGDVLVKTENDVINESIKNILDTSVGSRLFNREFGCNIQFLLFEPMNEITSNLIRIEIKQAIDRWEPRVEVLFGESQVVPLPDENLYRLRIVYRIINSNTTSEYNDFLNSNG